MKKIAFCLVLVMVLALAACTPAAAPTATADPAGTTNNSGNTAAGSATGYPAVDAGPAAVAPVNPNAYPAPGEVTLLFNGSNQTFMWSGLQQLSTTTVTVGDQTYTGYRLLDVLNQYGITEFATIDVMGAASSVRLDRSQLTDQDIVALAEDGTNLTLVLGAQPLEQWIQNVQSIVVQ